MDKLDLTLAQQDPQALSEYQSALMEDATRLFNQRIAQGSRRVYESDWRLFQTWCHTNHLIAEQATPPIVALFLTYQHQQNFHPTTINRRVAAIKFWFTSSGMKSPTEDELVKSIMKGIRRDKNAPASRIKKATLKEVLIQMVDLCPSNTLRGLRDRAILLLGFCGAYRRSELISIQIEDITWQSGKGMDIQHRFTKTDQEGKGLIKPIAEAKKELQYCPIRAIKAWISAAQITSGPLFRGITKGNTVKMTPMSEDVIYNLIKTCAEKLGYQFHDYSPHSLRSGFTTQALRNKARIDKITTVTTHKTIRSLEAYIKHEDRYEDHPGENFF